MTKRLRFWSALLSLQPLLLILSLGATNFSHGQDATHCTFDLNHDSVATESVLLVERKVTLAVASRLDSNRIRGFMEYLPPGYNPADVNTKYPVIIYFGGALSIGNGSTIELCDMLKDYSLPWRIERGTIPQVTLNGQTYKFIIISAQYAQYKYDSTSAAPLTFPSAAGVEAVINYVASHYNIDNKRIYLTGMSSGANMVMEYVASSVTRARRVAAIATSSLCSINGKFPNTQTAYQNIAAAKLPFWAVACTNDNLCNSSISQNWVNLINSANPAVPPILTLLNNCKGTQNHDSWTYTYARDTAFLPSQPQNVYTWFIGNIALPVRMKDYSVRLVDKKVEIKWTTTDEENNALFTIERAGPDQQFVPIRTIEGAGTTNLEQRYSFVDESPLAGLSFYRVLQTDEDGSKNYFEVKRVLNDMSKSAKMIVSPNPFSSNLSVFVNSSKNQKITFVITDMSGRRVSTTSGIYNQGVTEVKLKTNALSSGAYFLRAQGEAFSETQRIIKK